MHALILRMNEVLTAWKARYDVLSAVSMQFQTDEQGLLCFNDKPLCLLTDFTMDSARYDAERIVFHFAGKRRIQITICWPEDGTPYASSVFLGYYGLNVQE